MGVVQRLFCRSLAALEHFEKAVTNAPSILQNEKAENRDDDDVDQVPRCGKYAETQAGHNGNDIAVVLAELSFDALFTDLTPAGPDGGPGWSRSRNAGACLARFAA